MRTKQKPKEKPITTEPCAVPGCPEPGEFKAPKSRYNTNEYQYLCLEHVREFNQAWDYFDGWSRKEIEDFMDGAAHGHRPTWSLSNRVSGSQPLFTSEKLRDSFYHMLGEKPPKGFHKKAPTLPAKQLEAFAILDLEPGMDFPAIKAQYKKLVKKHHPDVNKGNKESEETFKRITAAYTILTKTYGPHDEK